MKFLPYLVKHLRRNWFRTTLTVLAMALCIFLFCTLQSVLAQINGLLEGSSAKRLVTRHSVSIVFNLPLAYGNRIAGVAGREAGGDGRLVRRLAAGKKEEKKTEESTTTDFSNFFPNLAVEPEPFLAMYPEYQLPPDQYQAFLQDLRGCVDRPQAGRALRLEGGRHLLPRELHPALPQARRAVRVRGEGHLRHRPREVPRHRHEHHAVQLQVPVRGHGAPARRRALLRRRSRTRRRPASSARRSTRCSRTPTRRRAPRRRRRSRPASWRWPATSRCC